MMNIFKSLLKKKNIQNYLNCKQKTMTGYIQMKPVFQIIQFLEKDKDKWKVLLIMHYIKYNKLNVDLHN